MITKIIESTQGDGFTNHGKFMLMRFDADEWARLSTVGAPAPLLGGVCGWSPEHVWMLDLQTGEGACFRPGGYAAADLTKHSVWACPMFEPTLAALYKMDLSDITALPDKLVLPDAPFAMQGYRRPGVGEASTRFCPYCGTKFELLPGTDMRVETTRDFPPPARVGIYAVPIGQRVNPREDPIVHYCEHGRPRPSPVAEGAHE